MNSHVFFLLYLFSTISSVHSYMCSIMENALLLLLIYTFLIIQHGEIDQLNSSIFIDIPRIPYTSSRFVTQKQLLASKSYQKCHHGVREHATFFLSACTGIFKPSEHFSDPYLLGNITSSEVEIPQDQRKSQHRLYSPLLSKLLTVLYKALCIIIHPK